MHRLLTGGLLALALYVDPARPLAVNDGDVDVSANGPVVERLLVNRLLGKRDQFLLGDGLLQPHVERVIVDRLTLAHDQHERRGGPAVLFHPDGVRFARPQFELRQGGRRVAAKEAGHDDREGGRERRLTNVQLRQGRVEGRRPLEDRVASATEFHPFDGDIEVVAALDTSNPQDQGRIQKDLALGVLEAGGLGVERGDPTHATVGRDHDPLPSAQDEHDSRGGGLGPEEFSDQQGGQDQARWVRLGHSDVRFLTSDLVDGGPVYLAAFVDVDVSPDRRTWFHLLGASCSRTLPLWPGVRQERGPPVAGVIVGILAGICCGWVARRLARLWRRW